MAGLANITYYPQAFEYYEHDTVTKEQLEEPGQLAELWQGDKA